MVICSFLARFVRDCKQIITYFCDNSIVYSPNPLLSPFKPRHAFPTPPSPLRQTVDGQEEEEEAKEINRETSDGLDSRLNP